MEILNFLRGKGIISIFNSSVSHYQSIYWATNYCDLLFMCRLQGLPWKNSLEKTYARLLVAIKAWHATSVSLGWARICCTGTGWIAEQEPDSAGRGKTSEGRGKTGYARIDWLSFHSKAEKSKLEGTMRVSSSMSRTVAGGCKSEHSRHLVEGFQVKVIWAKTSVFWNGG